MYDPQSEVASNKLHDKFHEFQIPPHGKPKAELHEVEEIHTWMEKRKMSRISDAKVNAHFVSGLLGEYVHTKETLQSMKHRGRAEITRTVSTRCSNLPPKNGM